MGPKSRTEMPRKTKIGTEVAHVTRDWDTTFKVKRSKVKVTGGGGILWRPRAHSLFPLQTEYSAEIFAKCSVSVSAETFGRSLTNTQ